MLLPKYAFGDSFTVGYDASVPANSYLGLVQSILGCTVTSNAILDNMVPDQAPYVYGKTLLNGDCSILYLGVNDQRIYARNALLQTVFQNGYAALALFLLLPAGENKKIVASSDGVVADSTWSTTTFYGLGQTSYTNGGRLSAWVYGTGIAVSYTMFDGNAGEADIYVDGANVGHIKCYAPAPMVTDLGVPYGPQLIVFPTTMGLHRVDVVVTTATSTANKVYVDVISGIGADKFSNVIICPNIPRMAAQGYISDGGSLQNVVLYNQALSYVQALMRTYGLDMRIADVFAALDITDDISPTDFIHPVDSGHAKIAHEVLKRLSAA